MFLILAMIRNNFITKLLHNNESLRVPNAKNTNQNEQQKVNDLFKNVAC